MMSKRFFISTSIIVAVLIVATTVIFGNFSTDDHGEAAAKLSKDSGHEEKSDSKKHASKSNDEHSEKDGHNDKDGHKDKGGTAERHSESEIKLTKKQIKLAEIMSVPVLSGAINIERQLTGEVKLNQDLVAHVVPRLTGIVKSVRAHLGSLVQAGDVMVVIDSRELADAKAAYVAGFERETIAKTKFNRERTLWKKKISSEQDYLEAKIKYSEAKIEKRSNEQKLLALGYTVAQLKNILDQSKGPYTRFEVAAPFGGTVIEKHVTKGELVDQKQSLYRLANLDKVWIIANVYEKDVVGIKLEQPASIVLKAYPGKTFSGKVTWISDAFDEKTRTLKIRVEVDNRHRLLKPGMFTRVALAIGTVDGILTVPPSALQRQGGETIVFVDEGGGRFERREVELGLTSPLALEVRKGLKAGEKVVTAGSFILRSELEKEGFGGGHGH